jgi:hypothetical protein
MMRNHTILGLAFLLSAAQPPLALNAQAAAAAAPAASAKGDTASAAAGFSIETEMLTYRSLESNSEAIACDIMGYLNNVKVFPKSGTPPPKKPVRGAPVAPLCNVPSTNSANVSLMLMPFDKTQLADFEIWRADMATMARLQHKAEAFDCPRGSQTKAGTTVATAAASSVLSMSPAGPPLALASSVAELLASQESTTSVGGTIQDQAFMDAVARELGALGVPVMMPSAYAPGSLAALDAATSPFLASLERTLAIGGCLALKSPKTDAMTDLDKEIVAFTATLNQSSTASTTPAAAQTAATAKPAAATSHMGSVLLADGLALQLGIDPDTGLPRKGGPAHHVLLIKALESGGSVTHRSNVLGSKINYSGGSVGTYALFSVEGALECSGNVYDYAGSFSSKNFVKGLHEYHTDPGQQMTFLRGGCSVPRAAGAMTVVR